MVQYCQSPPSMPMIPRGSTMFSLRGVTVALHSPATVDAQEPGD
ncbi:MAG TPA: hypothetical protein VF099_03320 [Ktedonobacterales bacterium]